MAERTFINVNDEINTKDINAIIDKFNAEASRRQRTTSSIFIENVNNEFEALGVLANSLTKFGEGESSPIAIVPESNCQPFNAAEPNSESYKALGSIISGDSEILADFANTIDESIVNLSSQLTSSRFESVKSYSCTCDIESNQKGCKAVAIGCRDCYDCSVTQDICGGDSDCCDYNCGCDIEDGCNIDDYCCDIEYTCDCQKVSIGEHVCEAHCDSDRDTCDLDYSLCDAYACIGDSICSCNLDFCNEVGCTCHSQSCPHNGCTSNCPSDCPDCGCNGECSCEGECCDNDWCEATQIVDNSYTAYSITGKSTTICTCDSVCSDFYNTDTFSGDNKGYLVCNGVNNTSITLHNMIANGNLSHIAKDNAVGWYNTPDPNIPNDQELKRYKILDEGAGYRAFRAFKLSANNDANFPRQYLYKQLEAGHKYYCSVWCKSSAPVASSAGIYIGLGDVSKTNPDIKNLYSAGKITTDWNLISGIYDIEQNTGKARINVWASSSGDNAINCDIYVSRFILIDLSAHIGANQLASKTSEEWKIWCDDNIREHHTFVNFGCRWSVETSTGAGSSAWSPKWTPEGASSDYEFKGFNYGNGKEFGDYVHVIRGIQDQTECYLSSKSKNSLDEEMLYYISYDAKSDSSESSASDNRTHTQVYWGGDANGSISEPSMGASLPLRKGIWKRISFLNGRPFPISRLENDERKENTYPVRLDFDNNGYADYMHVTNITCANILANISEYNKAYSSSIETKDINIYWCDRWIDNRNSTFIHLNNPDIKEPSFVNGKVTANDIIIKPETNTITVDTETGTVFCKKLIIL